MRASSVPAACLWFVVSIAPPAPQTELDRIVARVNTSIITQSDVHQARVLALVEDASSDETVERALEDRLLILREMAHAAPVIVADADVAARRAAWEPRLGGAARATAALAAAGMSDGALQVWMRDDARIQAYLKGQFGTLPDAERARTMAEWITRLRQRAGLK